MYVCWERLRLLDNVNEAVNRYDQAACTWGDIASTGNHATFTAYSGEVRTDFSAVQAAWNRYWDHVKAHGC